MEIKRVAFPTNDKNSVESHFGHCKEFAIFSIKAGEIVEKEFIDAPPHQPGLLPRFLGERNIDTIITGGMGQRAVDLFKEQNIEVILGARGSMEEVLSVYLGGDLYSTGSTCSNHERGCSH